MRSEQDNASAKELEEELNQNLRLDVQTKTDEE